MTLEEDMSRCTSPEISSADAKTRREAREAVHAWIRDDLSVSAKMAVLPKHVEALIARLVVLSAAPSPPASSAWRDWPAPETVGAVVLARNEEGDLFGMEWNAEGYWMSPCGQPVVQSPDPVRWMPAPEDRSLDGSMPSLKVSE